MESGVGKPGAMPAWRTFSLTLLLLASPSTSLDSLNASHAPSCEATGGSDCGLSLLHVGQAKLGKGQLLEDAEDLAAEGVAEQVGAAIPVGGEVRLYAVGSSNLVYEAWYDMLVAMLRTLGYSLPTQEFRLARISKPARMPRCDDTQDFEGLLAPRLGKPGWASWGFAYENNSDCEGQDHGFRRIGGYFVKCMNGWSCMREIDNPPEVLYRPSAIAQEAASAHIVFLSHWINDSKQWMTAYSCYGATRIDQIDTVTISVSSTLRLIRAIHEVNPHAYIVVVARYPEQHGVYVRNGTVGAIDEINAAMKKGLEHEPRTLFADFKLPAGEVMFQSRSQMAGHPNCRGDRVMATSVVDALFRGGVLARGLDLGGSAECLARKDCAQLGAACCRRSALCRWAGNGTCVQYGPGEGLITTEM